MGKLLARWMFAFYLAMLTWVLLFKLRLRLSAVLHRRHRSLNLTPFAAPSMVNGQINYGEMVLNCLVFIPFGLLLSAAFKKIAFLPKFACILLFSLAVELTQYIFAIGAADITDVILNTTGGLLGLVLYELSNKYIATEKLDRTIVSVGTVLLVLFISLQAGHFLRLRF